VARNPLVLFPGEAATRQLSISDQVLQGGATRRAGEYKMTWRDLRDAEQTQTLAASFDLTESNLEPINDAELSKLLAPIVPSITHWTSAAALAPEKGREIWRDIVLAVLTLAAVETV